MDLPYLFGGGLALKQNTSKTHQNTSGPLPWQDLESGQLSEGSDPSEEERTGDRDSEDDLARDLSKSLGKLSFGLLWTCGLENRWSRGMLFFVVFVCLFLDGRDQRFVLLTAYRERCSISQWTFSECPLDELERCPPLSTGKAPRSPTLSNRKKRRYI